MADLIDLLPEWLPQQRWFGAKGRRIHGITLLADRTIMEGNPTCRHVLVQVDLGEDKETYQLLVGCRPELPERLEDAHRGVAVLGEHITRKNVLLCLLTWLRAHASAVVGEASRRSPYQCVNACRIAEFRHVGHGGQAGLALFQWGP